MSNVYKVIVIDDERLASANVSLCATSIEDPRFHVIGTYNSPQAGIEAFSEHRPDIVTIDLNMDEMNGVETMKRLKEIDPGVRAIGVTSESTSANALGMLKAGARFVLAKQHLTAETLREAFLKAI